MKKVLIICDLFPPAFGPRMGYLCKYLRIQGWEPIVLTEAVNENTFTFLTKGSQTTYVQFYTASNFFFKKIQWLYTLLFDFCFNYKDIRMYHAAEKLIKKYQFSLIICSSYRTFPLLASVKVSQKHNLPLVVDLRDIIEQYTGHEFISHTMPSFCGFNKLLVSLFKYKYFKTRNKVLQKADYITTVSPWHVKILKQYNPKVELIYNGFDPELFYPVQQQTDQFIITYTGRLLSTAMRDPGLLLEALSILSTEKFFTEKECQVHWYVDDASQEIIKKEAKKHRVLSFMEFKGYVPASNIPDVLNNSSIILLLTNQSKENGPKGIMTTKFFEALAVEKPILCVRSDESYLAQTLHETNAGLAATQVEEVCDFIKSYYGKWKSEGYTKAPVNQNKLASFSREGQAKQFIQIFEKTINHG